MHPLIPYFAPVEIDVPWPGGHPVALAGFGLLAGVGFLAGGAVAMRRAARRGLDPTVVRALIPWLVVAALVGGHLAYGALYQPAVYLAAPRLWFEVWHGLSSVGGLLACTVVAALFFRRRGLPFWPYADVLAYALPTGWAFGRLGCFVAHDHPGTPTRFWLGVYGICPNQPRFVACHDMGLYEAIGSAVTALAFAFLGRKPRRDRFFTLALGLSYAPVRFAMDFWRPETTDPRWFGLTAAQFAMCGLFALCVALLPDHLD